MATDLFCCERLQPDLRKTEKDPVIFNDVRVINNLLCLEKQYVPSCDYFSMVQMDIKPFMRKVVSTWMLEVCEELGVEEQVFPLAVNYLDRFLCNCCINKRHLQLAASVCIMMASKIRQCQYVSIETLCFYADHSITPQAMKSGEEEVKEWKRFGCLPLEVCKTAEGSYPDLHEPEHPFSLVVPAPLPPTCVCLSVLTVSNVVVLYQGNGQQPNNLIRK
ncbi:hypothetical protein RUM44_008128 [Polyplax serrata]|uniref:Cyclin-like domain-containing protein n=1 Tax=Polyplax serrata TaxID=468196 RepID=A0ABR1BBF9_POLSC